jgi:hypothetical protein
MCLRGTRYRARPRAHACVPALLHREVVDDGADFLDEETEQRACLDIADGFIHVLREIALHRHDCLVAHVLVEFDCHGFILALRASGDAQMRMKQQNGAAGKGAPFGYTRAL